MRNRNVHRTVLLGATIAFLLGVFVAPLGAVASPLVVIDPGHGGPYSNANANGLREKDVNLRIALELRNQLLARGYRVALTRTTDRAVRYSDTETWNWSDRVQRWYFKADGHAGLYGGIPKDDLQGRVDVANKAGADVFISIHNNGSANKAARGTETFASPRDSLGRSLAKLVHSRVVSRTGLHDRGAQTADFYVCRWTDMPAILVEGAFISNSGDAALLKQSSFRRKMALGIADGLDAWFAKGPFTSSSRAVRTASAVGASIKVSRLHYPNGANKVVLARADRWAEAPSVAALATKLRAPLLWLGDSHQLEAVSDELERLAPSEAVLVGVTDSLDESLVSLIASASALPTSSVEVISEDSRAELAVSIAATMGPTAKGTILVVDEGDSWSMRAAAGASAGRGLPILLSSQGRLPATATDLISSGALSGTRTTYLVGARSALPAATVGRLPGARRIEGSFSERVSKINAAFYPPPGGSALSAVVADQTNGAEYVTASRWAAKGVRPVVPVKAGRMTPYTRLWMTNRRSALVRFEVFDAHRSLPWSMEHALRKADWE